MNNMPAQLIGREPGKVWEHFRVISSIPHCSGNETQLREYVLSIARRHQLTTRSDSAQNLLVRLPGDPGADSKGVTLQCHLDMVCEKKPDCSKEMQRDPLTLLMEEDDWLSADGTTLGADNGIGAAICLALMESPELRTGPVDLLFTVSEEVGLVGAKGLDPAMLAFRRLVNLDAEEVASFCIGCAGSLNTDLILPCSIEYPPSGWKTMLLEIGGLKGGHSGLDIHLGRANAIKLAVRFLQAVDRKYGLKLADLQGGKSHNVIPRECRAQFLIPQEAGQSFTEYAETVRADLQREFAHTDPDLELVLTPAEMTKPATVLTGDSQKTLLALLTALPHGICSFEPAMDGQVRTSSNLAMVKLALDRAQIHTKQRSSMESELAAASQTVISCADLAGAQTLTGGGYPPWQPDTASSLLRVAQKCYRDVLGVEARVGSLHAGLECSVIGGKFQDMEMLSVGPDIVAPHSPNERVRISSVEKLWVFLQALLAKLADGV